MDCCGQRLDRRAERNFSKHKVQSRESLYPPQMPSIPPMPPRTTEAMESPASPHSMGMTLPRVDPTIRPIVISDFGLTDSPSAGLESVSAHC
jgi:hypothetical protein